jgi:hypothetical protein
VWRSHTCLHRLEVSYWKQITGETSGSDQTVGDWVLGGQGWGWGDCIPQNSLARKDSVSWKYYRTVLSVWQPQILRPRPSQAWCAGFTARSGLPEFFVLSQSSSTVSFYHIQEFILCCYLAGKQFIPWIFYLLSPKNLTKKYLFLFKKIEALL